MGVDRFDLGPFLGASTSLDSRYIPETSASDLRNVRIEDGALRVRYGFKKLSNSFGNQNGSVIGFDYCAGYDANSAFLDEYISVERSSVGPNNYFPFSRHSTTGVATQIKQGVTSIPFTAGDWKSFAFKNLAYLFSPTSSPSVYRHTLGDATSLAELAVPATPNAPTYTVTYGATSYNTVNFNGLNVSTGVTYSGSATSTNSSVATDVFTIGHLANSNLASSVLIDLNGTTQSISDWSNNDIFGLQLNNVTPGTFSIVADSVRLTLYNNDGSPATLTPSRITLNNRGDVNHLDLGLRFEFDKSDRTLWDNVRKVKLEYTVTGSSGTAANNKLTLKMYIGGVWINDPYDRGNEAYRCSFYHSTLGYESALSNRLWIPTSATYGAAVIPDLAGLGVHLTLTYAGFASGTNYDRVRFYKETYTDPVGFENQSHLLNTSSSGTHVHKITLAEVLVLPVYSATPVPFNGGVVSACTYKSWVAWCLKGTLQNVRHSKIGFAEFLASEADQLDDETRGANFSLPGDEALCNHEAGDGHIILGSSGVYAQTGDAPTRMTSIQKVPGSRGSAGRWSSAVWRDDSGTAGVVFVDAAGEAAWFVSVTNGFAEDRAGTYLVQEITENVRGLIRSFLLDGQTVTDTSLIRVTVDTAQDALWIVLNKRALVLRRRSKVSQAREWECYEFNIRTAAAGNAATTIAFIAGSSRRRLKWIRQTGELDDVEWDTVGNAYITGANRDGTFAMPSNSIYWTSKKFTTPFVSRINHVLVDRDTLSNTPTITGYCTRQIAGVSKTLVSGKNFFRFFATQSGNFHQFKIAMTEGDDPIRRVEIERFGPDSQRGTS